MIYPVFGLANQQIGYFDLVSPLPVVHNAKRCFILIEQEQPTGHFAAYHQISAIPDVVLWEKRGGAHAK